jgi:hypothetical protein
MTDLEKAIRAIVQEELAKEFTNLETVDLLEVPLAFEGEVVPVEVATEVESPAVIPAEVNVPKKKKSVKAEEPKVLLGNKKYDLTDERKEFAKNIVANEYNTTSNKPRLVKVLEKYIDPAFHEEIALVMYVHPDALEMAAQDLVEEFKTK